MTGSAWDSQSPDDGKRNEMEMDVVHRLLLGEKS